jgi:hypothetical protein
VGGAALATAFFAAALRACFLVASGFTAAEAFLAARFFAAGIGFTPDAFFAARFPVGASTSCGAVPSTSGPPPLSSSAIHSLQKVVRRHAI